MKHSPLAKALCCSLIAASPLLGAYARHMSPDEAIARLLNNESQRRMAGSEELKLAYVESAENQDFVYVFNKKSNGFIVVSADDSMPALLGYSNNGSFNPETVAPSLKWWLSQYAEEAAFSISSYDLKVESNSHPRLAPEVEKEEIPYLIKTQWGQRNPYNLKCPELNNNNCVTGCVATAMAQILKYHEYPATGFDENSYQWNDTTLSFDFGATEFRFNDMLDNYKDDSDESQDSAVAELMYACGVSVNMLYGAKESGASDIYIPYALRHYFKYDNEVKLLKRSFYSSEEWKDLVYSELEQQRPVIMGGQAPSGGHQFICDGYDGDGFFHINWGWEGMSDGCYLLSALNPEEQGIGGHNGGYNSNQTIVCGIKPAKEDSAIWYPIYANSGMGISNYTNSNINIVFEQGGILNESPEGVTVTMLVQAESEDGKTYISDQGSTLKFPGAENLQSKGFRSFSAGLPTDMPAGKYKAYIVFKTPEGNIQKLLFPYTSISYFYIDVDASGKITCTIGEPSARAEIRVLEFEPLEQIISNEVCMMKIVLENIGEYDYDDFIKYIVYPHDSDEALYTTYLAFNSIAPQKKINSSIPSVFDLKAGLYDIVFFDQYGDIISDKFTISVDASGVASIVDTDLPLDIYSARGILIKKNADSDYLSSLPKGIYIIKSKDNTFKIIK
ncbi:MAG: thiol protease/hemagglutinin PrtT [Muribaculaceae bacterium]|nr:thiol protease/hemagglutinin PrtT [Muribaculaceae bacterium]